MRTYLQMLSLAMAALATPAAAGELDYVLVSSMPEVTGAVESTLTGVDASSGVTFTRTIHAWRDEGHAVETHAVRTHCTGVSEVAGIDRPFIVAVQHRPLHPRNAAEATLRNLFQEVYIRDGNDRVRLYQNLDRREMATMTDKLLPRCQQI